MNNAVQKYLPSNAGQTIMGHTKFTPAHLLAPWAGLAVFTAYAAFALIAAAASLHRRDL